MNLIRSIFWAFEKNQPDASKEETFRAGFNAAFKVIDELLDERYRLVEGFPMLSERRVLIGQLKNDMENYKKAHLGE